MGVVDWVTGDTTGMGIPAHVGALGTRPEAFLTEAFRASGALSADNAVTAVTRFDELSVGGTGSKLILSVTYAHAEGAPPRDLFVKFSRDFSDPLRDGSRYMLDAEVRLALLSRGPNFPIAVPRCAFADYHGETGTGVLITERIHYGSDGIEPHYAKCRDDELPDQLDHYRAVITALARLSGSHRGGSLPERTGALFPFDPVEAGAADRFPYTARQLQNRVARYGVFAERYPRLLPDTITTPEFIGSWAEDVVLFSENEGRIQDFLQGAPDLVALCHWNANIDNAWFWRNGDGVRECGLLDWGRVGQMNVARALYGALSGAGPAFWREHATDLVESFAAEYHRCGGPEVDAVELRTHLDMVTATMGLAYLMDAPPLIQLELPDLDDVTGPTDPRLTSNENARVLLHMMTMFLNQWQTRDFGTMLRDVLG
ncbi:hypothetical protein MMAD_05800 [Mycolicibacterium madagascariense]|uniref:Aminoglycoside phosphotransferase domain-containing protein n=1 Tax=Mycolicibacterium madagascariense TaxID=212765 RepID=A0A7I7XAF6_9MYCO|nr:hypothetical protein [Mycolicibacterium madagascariense]MCV7011862.1 hypothetical protein [Mycolicibacterium madagascariense]BBZ26285.1 hypothetical protein MMAD_05800 [Mycolicibacterium madagascariense]